MIPTEFEEQVALRQYCDIKRYAYFAVPNETYTTSYNQKRRNRAKGVVKGVPDFWCIVNGHLVAIELKRVKGGRASPEQVDWIDRLRDVGVLAIIAKGADEAIAYLERLA